MLPDFPLPFPVHFQPAAVQDQMQRPACLFGQPHAQRSSPARQRRVVGHRQLDLQECKERAHGQHGFDGAVAVGELCTALGQAS